MKIRATVAAIAAIGFAAIVPAAKADDTVVSSGSYVLSTTDTGSVTTVSPDSYGKA